MDERLSRKVGKTERKHRDNRESLLRAHTLLHSPVRARVVCVQWCMIARAHGWVGGRVGKLPEKQSG
jgi:hypothetical protein